MPESDRRPLTTKWSRGKWELKDSKTENVVHLQSDPTDHRKLHIRLEEKINSNPTYQKYLERHLNNIEQGIGGAERFTEHEKGYYRTLISSFATLGSGCLALVGGGFLGGLKNLPGIEDNDDRVEDINIASFTLFTVGVIGTVIGSSFTIASVLAQERGKKEIELFNELSDLKAKIPDIDKEITIKEKAINRIIDFLERNRIQTGRGAAFNPIERQTLFNDIAIAIDKKDDLNIYENIEKTLRIVGYMNTHKLLEDTVHLLLLGSVYDQVYVTNQAYLDRHPPTSRSIHALMIELPARNQINIPNYTNSMSAFMVTQLIDILSDKDRLDAAKMLFTLASDIPFPLDNPVHLAEIFRTLSQSMYYKAIQENIQAILTDQSKETIFSNYLVTRFGMAAPQQDINTFKEIIKILSTEKLFDEIALDNRGINQFRH